MMGCRCCGGPVVGGTGFVTTVKYAPTGHVMWWTDSGLDRNVGKYDGGVFYELSGPSSVSGSISAILRTIDADTGAALLSRYMGVSQTCSQINVIGGVIYACMLPAWKIHRISPVDLSSSWTFSQTSTETFGGRPMMEDDLVIIPATESSVNKFKAYDMSTGTATFLWEINATDGTVSVERFIGHDSSGYLIAIGSDSASPRHVLSRYDDSGSLIDRYEPSDAAIVQCTHCTINGTDLWLRCPSGVSGLKIIKLDTSLSEVFVTTSVTADSSAYPLLIRGTSCYAAGQRYVYRVDSNGDITTRYDHGSNIIGAGCAVSGDTAAFCVRRSTSTFPLLGFDDSTVPATSDWTMTQTVQESVATIYMHDAQLSHDASGNFYVPGRRLADTALDKVP